MTIDEHLLRDERILADARASTKGVLYATNKRVIRYEKGFFGEKVDSLYYRHVVGASYESRSYIWLIAVGFLFLIFGWLLSPMRYVGGLGALLMLAGVVAILVAFLYRPAWFQIKAVGVSPERWRTAGVGADAKTFARFIEDQISRREVPPPSVRTTKEVITKEIVMVKCEYCSALMPQTASFCPNCGATRK